MNDIYININKGAEIKGLKSTRCHWVEYVHETDYCDMNLIKQACKGKQKVQKEFKLKTNKQTNKQNRKEV